MWGEKHGPQMGTDFGFPSWHNFRWATCRRPNGISAVLSASNYARWHLDHLLAYLERFLEPMADYYSSPLSDLPKSVLFLQWEYISEILLRRCRRIFIHRFRESKPNGYLRDILVNFHYFHENWEQFPCDGKFQIALVFSHRLWNWFSRHIGGIMVHSSPLMEVIFVILSSHF